MEGTDKGYEDAEGMALAGVSLTRQLGWGTKPHLCIGIPDCFIHSLGHRAPYTDNAFSAIAAGSLYLWTSLI